MMEHKVANYPFKYIN